MYKLNAAIERFCIRHPNFGIPNLMLYVVISNVAVFLLTRFSSKSAQFLQSLAFTLSGVLHGQVWRLVSFVFIPESTSPLFLFISCYFYYWIGSTLERRWGTAKFTTYYLCGMALTVIGASIVSLIAGVSFPVYGAAYINFAMFLAFALLYPDAQVLLFFVIPVRMKILAYIDLAYFAYGIVSYIADGVWFYAILPITALLNFVVFFWPEICRFLKLNRQQARQATHFHNTVSHQQRQETVKPYRHKCAVCGRTDVSNPELQFRYCSQCAGYHCFCSDHIFSHVHFTDENP
ncbi:MAG: rhomboid family intramembrane serine protease [Oscillospiraceae bacterium]|nr:rhomboid family intramembrane serine protease [Oscillospiraceae bacterium]